MTPPHPMTFASGLQLPGILAAVPAHAITFVVEGKSATKGSTVSFVAGDGRVITRNDNERTKGWSETVAWSARAARVRMVRKPGAVAVRITVTFARPKSKPAEDVPFCIDPPDVDKCTRAALDALTGIAYEDDAQVVHQSIDKFYDDEPRTVIQVWEVRP